MNEIKELQLMEVREYLVWKEWNTIKDEIQARDAELRANILSPYQTTINVSYNGLLFDINSLADEFISKISNKILKKMIQHVIIDFNNERLLTAPWRSYKDDTIVSVPSGDREEFSSFDILRCQRKILAYIVSLESAFTEKDWQPEEKKDNIHKVWLGT